MAPTSDQPERAEKEMDYFSREEQKWLDSWKEAMEHRWDWVWEIGEKLKRWNFNLDSALIILLILLVFAFLTWMVKPMLS